MKAFAGQVLIFKRPPVYSFFSFFLVVVFFSSPAYIHAAAVQADWRFIRFGACLVACVADHVLLAGCLAFLRRYSLLADQPLAPVPQLIRVWLVATFAPSKLSSSSFSSSSSSFYSFISLLPGAFSSGLNSSTEFVFHCRSYHLFIDEATSYTSKGCTGRKETRYRRYAMKNIEVVHCREMFVCR